MNIVSVVAKFQCWWRNRASPKRVLARSAFCDEGGVSQFDWLGDEEVHHRIAWEQVETVIAFKMDLFAYDDICVALLNDRGEVLASVSEASGSFGAFIKGLPKWLSGCKRPDEWWDGVAFPAFQPNETVLYRRCRQLPGPEISAGCRLN
jgi:hypothetical protein